MNPVIISAISDKQCLSFSYDGHQRIVEPHAYGITKNGNEILRAYQVQGGHVSYHSKNWHIFSLSKIKYLALSGMNFSGARQGYKRGDGAMSRIYEEL